MNRPCRIRPKKCRVRTAHHIRERRAVPALHHYEVIEACNEADPPVAMVFTGQRCFKH